VSEIESIHDLNADLFQPEEVERFSNPVEARKKAMDYLARREYGRLELEQKLAAAGFETTIASAAVAKLSGEGLQDDSRFVENFVRSRINQGKGPVRIHQELDERGLAASLVDDALEATGEDWVELARTVRHKKFGAGVPRDFKEKARQMRFLQYRGFDSDQIQAAMQAHGDA